MKPLVGQKFIIKNTIIQLVFHNSNELEYTHIGNRFPHFFETNSFSHLCTTWLDTWKPRNDTIYKKIYPGALQMDEEIELEQ